MSNDSSQLEKSHDEISVWNGRLIIALLLGIPITILHLSMLVSHMSMELFMQPAMCGHGVNRGQVLMVCLNIPMLSVVGYSYYRSAILSASHGSFGMDFLVMTGSSITFIYSFCELMFACQSGNPTRNVFFEGSGMLLMFVTIGKYIEAYAKGKSASAITSLLNLQPKQVCLLSSIIS